MAARPVEPPPTSWHFPPVDAADEDGLVGVGADLEPGTLLAAYRTGLFPMPVGRDGPMGWWSPDPRGVLPLDGLRLSRSLRRSTRRYEVRVDTSVRGGDARVRRPAAGRAGGSPSRSSRPTTRMHELGWAHSVETWSDEGELVGGLYGVAIGGFFAGESMFQPPAPTRRRWRSSTWSTGCGARATGCSTCSGRRRTSRTLGAIEIRATALRGRARRGA